MNEMVATLTKARDAIAQGFCQGPWAQDGVGRPVHPCSLEAISWCGAGALMLAVIGRLEEVWGPNRPGHGLRLFEQSQWERLRHWCNDQIYAMDKIGYGSLVNFSEAPGRTQAQMLAMFDQLIERAQNE